MTMTPRHFAIVPLLAVLSAPSQAAVGVRILLGLTDNESTKWDGSATARGAQITSIEPWRFEGKDAINGDQWTVSTHNIRLFGGQLAPAARVVANGVVVWLSGESDSSELQVKTSQGSFNVKLSDIPYGKASFALDKRVMADRVPGFTRLTNSPDEQDYPAA